MLLYDRWFNRLAIEIPDSCLRANNNIRHKNIICLFKIFHLQYKCGCVLILFL